ncbi:MAG: Hsp20/alpha crystallin family protein [Acholeplasma sp.]|nr:Hsp20/alpha crystallin family protein [Acholeplasma sp.]
MMIPRRKDFDILEDIFKDPIFNVDESKIMKTDIKEHENNYSIVVDLPGYNKEDIKVSVEDGYLTIHATMNSENEEKEKGKFVRRERYFGECSRSFYVGDDITTEDIKASYKNGSLKLEVPKKEVRKEIPEKTYVEIED